MTDVVSQLQDLVAGAQSSKSSHWLHHTDASRMDGFGTDSRTTPLRAAFHRLGQRILFPGSDIFGSREYRMAQSIVRKQGRVLDLDVLRHAFTLRLLAATLPDPGLLCVIGDGRGNLAGLALAQGYARKVISVNLPEVLAQDHLILRRGGIVDEAGSVALVGNKAELHAALADDAVKMILVSAHQADCLSEEGIPLFVNIASFQEMRIETVQAYLRLIHSNGADIYSCNRQEKTLYGGEVVRLSEYGWENFDVLFAVPCPWHQRLYMSRPPFIRNYDGQIIHSYSRARPATA